MNFKWAEIGPEAGKHKFAAPSQLSPCRHFLLTPEAKYETINLRLPDISTNSISHNMLYLGIENVGEVFKKVLTN